MRKRSASSSALAPTFAALGDETRLALVNKLCQRSPRSIGELSEDSTLTRQAVTKHLHVLAGAGLVRRERQGRLSLYALQTQPLDAMAEYLKRVSTQWDDALLRLKSFIEE